MALHHASAFRFLFSSVKEGSFKFSSLVGFPALAEEKHSTLSHRRMEHKVADLRKSTRRTFRSVQKLRSIDGNGEQASETDDDGSLGMDEEERHEWRRKIREVIDMNPNIEEELDPLETINKTQKLVADYPLVMEEEDPDWPEDDNGWGFKLGQFFDKITIKNKRKDDEEYDSENEIVWEDDNYIRPIKDITTTEWEETVFKDFSPLLVLVHNRYRRPKENERVRDELEKAVHIIWNCRLPSPRCVAVDAVVEHDLVSALQVSVYPEIIFTKSGKILYREKSARTADELSKIMAFFYYGAGKPPCLNGIPNSQEAIPSVPNLTVEC